MVTTLLIFIALGLDTLAVAVGLGMAGLPAKRWLSIGVTFALFEGLMPAAGVLVGRHAVGFLGPLSHYAAGGLLVGLGVLEIKEYVRGDDDSDELVERIQGGKLLAAGLSVSLDELTMGISMGILKIPMTLALLYIGGQAFGVTFLGLYFGKQIGKQLGGKAELIAGIVLSLLGVFIIVRAGSIR